MAVYRDSRDQTKIRFQYTDHKGIRRTATPPEGTTWKEAEKLFRQVQAEHDNIRKGLIPPPREGDTVLLSEALDAYLDEGKRKGMNRKKPRPWSKKHIDSQNRMKEWALNSLGVRTVGDLEGGLAKIDEALAKLHADGPEKGGLHGKTVNSYGSGLHTFLKWCQIRGYLQKDPMSHWVPYDKTPSFIRRAPTVEEVRLLIEHAPVERKLLYQVAICSGLRANELRQLKVENLVDEGISLPAEVAKNRKATLQPLPKWLVADLRKACEYKLPSAELLWVPVHTARVIRMDFKRAGVTDQLEKMDFHAFGRVGYINLVLDSGARVKEAMELARHSTPDLTLNTYGRTRDERLREITEKVGEVVKAREA